MYQQIFASKTGYPISSCLNASAIDTDCIELFLQPTSLDMILYFLTAPCMKLAILPFIDRYRFILRGQVNIDKNVEVPRLYIVRHKRCERHLFLSRSVIRHEAFRDRRTVITC